MLRVIVAYLGYMGKFFLWLRAENYLPGGIILLSARIYFCRLGGYLAVWLIPVIVTIRGKQKLERAVSLCARARKRTLFYVTFLGLVES